MTDVTLSASDLTLPIFIRETDTDPVIAGLPDVRRYTLDEIVPYVETALSYGVRSFAFFPCTPHSVKSDDGREALNSNNLICRALSNLKKEFGSDVGCIADVALDPYTTHGHDGIITPPGQGNKNWRVDNDETRAILSQQAVVYAQAGADCVAPSDMMDGRIGAVRAALDQAGYEDTLILSYAAKYATSFYGPFRSAVGAQALSDHSEPELHHKKTYQMDFRRTGEALHEVAQDLQEGADMIMVKPALLHLDTIHIVRTTFEKPTFAYHVSGEYACLKYAHQAGVLSYDAALMEVLYSLKRAGCHGIFSYGALDAARILRDQA